MNAAYEGGSMRVRNRAGSKRTDVKNLESINNVENTLASARPSPGAGPGGYCQCPNCGIQIEHQRGKPCFYMKCPKCNADMRRV